MLFSGEIEAKDVEAVWNELYSKYLGIEVTNPFTVVCRTYTGRRGFLVISRLTHLVIFSQLSSVRP